MVQPVLQQREKEAQTVPGYTKPNDTIQWLHDLIPAEDKKDYAFQGVIQLAITAVSVQSTSKLIVNVILNLIKYAEYVPVLVEEIQTVLAECGGEWTLDSMGRLEKLDSFIRESLRFEPPLTGKYFRSLPSGEKANGCLWNSNFPASSSEGSHTIRRDHPPSGHAGASSCRCHLIRSQLLPRPRDI